MFFSLTFFIAASLKQKKSEDLDLTNHDNVLMSPLEKWSARQRRVRKCNYFVYQGMNVNQKNKHQNIKT